MQRIVNTTNIQTFATDVNIDILNRKFIFDISNSVFNNSPAGFGVKVAFEVIDSGGIPLSTIDWNDPQIPDASVTQTYDLDLSGIVDYFFLFQSYKIRAAANDDGNIVYLEFPVIDVCQPKNFTDAGYVEGTMVLKVNCTDNILNVSEITDFSYCGLQPYETNTDGTLYYPQGTKSPVAFTFTPFSDTNIYTGNYRIDNTTTALYDLGYGVTVSIAYSTIYTGDFNCEKAMENLLCCIIDFQAEMEKHCGDAIGASMKERWNNASIPFLTGLLKEMNGEDATFFADQVKKILRCNCNRATIKKVQPNSFNPNIYNIIVTGVGGTTATQSTVGSTKNFTVSSNIYSIIKKDVNDLAFTIYQPDTSTPYNVKYPIGFNYDLMAASIYTATANSQTLLTQLNSLIYNLGLDLSNLNGSCIIDLSSTNYFLSQRLASSASEVINIVIGSTTYTVPANILVNNTSSIEAWLNGLGLGTFAASFSLGTTGAYINVLSVDNANTCVSMTFSTPTGSVTTLFQKTNKSLVAVLQAIIDYLCELTAANVQLGTYINLCYVDYNDQVVTLTYSPSSTQASFNSGVATAVCNLISQVTALQSVTCDKIKSLFSSYPSAVFGASDTILAVVNGNCTLLSLKQLGLAVISSINTYSDVKDAFCAIDCEVPATCPDITANNVSVVAGDIAIYGATFATTPSSVQIVTVRYKLSSSATWITSTNALQLFPNGTINGVSPYLITGVSAGAIYDIWITNNCGGEGFISQITTPTNPIYSGQYYVGNAIYGVCSETATTLYSASPFNTGVTMYVDAGLTTPLTGFTYIVPSTSGLIYVISSTTGVVGANTGLSCENGIAGLYILGTYLYDICGNTPETLYTGSTFNIGVIVFQDVSLSTPVTGYTYIYSVENNAIYTMDSVTGEVLSNTGLTCTGEPVEVQLGNTEPQACAAETIAAYTPNGYSFIVGDILYTDAALTTPLIGYSYVVISTIMYNLNSATGQIGAPTGNAC